MLHRLKAPNHQREAQSSILCAAANADAPHPGHFSRSLRRFVHPPPAASSSSERFESPEIAGPRTHRTSTRPRLLNSPCWTYTPENPSLDVLAREKSRDVWRIVSSDKSVVGRDLRKRQRSLRRAHHPIKSTHTRMMAPQRIRDAPTRIRNRTHAGHLSSRLLSAETKWTKWNDDFFDRREVSPTAHSFLFVRSASCPGSC